MSRSSFYSGRPIMAAAGVFMVAFLMLLAVPAEPQPLTDCSTVMALISMCSTYITYGTPEPLPGTPCCDAMTTLNMIAGAESTTCTVCRCLMGLIASYSPNASAIASLSGLCGVSLGFDITPTTDCN
ncbi:hypothetical protein CDL15_Pgr021800 [Punica granatum]|nr:hypothetical protein CDL15_Pgr021800 [Punica granatum]PKI32915.1 hypothetical protein CRG98_046689 [Punica granatum]